MDSAKKRTRFAPFERKLREYPVVIGKYLDAKVDLSGDVDLELFVRPPELRRTRRH